ncbi:GMC oxidoreductase-domain-containing protein, partial [Mrakia frigida]|uniref:GMC oxidoreductase-domain-containing protein n=1 Tax=Mrakia frigida TaxID=29902 RepID=UPI003FCC148C
ANKEVIIACGSIQSPALLQLSGVGPASLLSSVGVETVIDLPGVGKNLNEQTSNVIGFTPNSGVEFGGIGPSDTIAFPSFNQLFGADSESTASQLASNIPAFAKAAADAGGVVSETAATALFELQRSLIVDNQVGLAELFFDSGYPNGGFGLDIWNLLPFSRGTVEITSNDPFVAPKIDPKYFAFDFDLDVQAAAMKMGRRVFQNAPLSTLVSGENSPGYGTVAEDGQGGTLDDWKTYVKGSYGSVSHPISTCAMMAQDLGGVVGEDLKVYGTANVRVVDASVLPMQVSAHLSASIYGVAEYAADLIKVLLLRPFFLSSKCSLILFSPVCPGRFE